MARTTGSIYRDRGVLGAWHTACRATAAPEEEDLIDAYAR